MYTARRRGMPRGKPNEIMERDNRVKVLAPGSLPTADQAVQSYELSGGRLSDPSMFGSDPLHGEKQEIRNRAFHQKFPSFRLIFSSLVNGDNQPFKQALSFFIDVTRRLSV